MNPGSFGVLLTLTVKSGCVYRTPDWMRKYANAASTVSAGARSKRNKWSPRSSAELRSTTAGEMAERLGVSWKATRTSRGLYVFGSIARLSNVDNAPALNRLRSSKHRNNNEARRAPQPLPQVGFTDVPRVGV